MIEHRFKLNPNGNSAQDLRDQFMELHQLAMSLRAHLAKMDHTHGRNYLTVEHGGMAQAADAAEKRQHLMNVEDLVEYAMSGAARVIRQREGI